MPSGTKFRGRSTFPCGKVDLDSVLFSCNLEFRFFSATSACSLQRACFRSLSHFQLLHEHFSHLMREEAELGVAVFVSCGNLDCSVYLVVDVPAVI